MGCKCMESCSLWWRPSKCFWQNNFIRLFQFSWSEQSCSDGCSGVGALKHLYLQDSSAVFETKIWFLKFKCCYGLYGSCWKLSTESWAPAGYLCCPFLNISTVIRIWWKKCLVVILYPATRSLQSLAHVITVMTCAKFCSDYSIRIQMRAKQIF